MQHFDPSGTLDESDYLELMNELQNMTLTEIKINETETCIHCGDILQRSINNISSTCVKCGIITEYTEELNTTEMTNNKLRIVGMNNNHFQPDLYRSDNGNISQLQKKQIFSEYKDYRQRFIDAGGRPFPLNACELATDFYNKIQQKCVKRSQNKKAIMAACLWQACLRIEFAPSKIEISRFMQLPHKGIARGNNFIRALVSDNQLDINPNTNPIYPEIKTLFLQLDYNDEKYKVLHDIIYNIIEIATKNSIGINSLPRSKVIGTTYIVLKRCKDTSLVACPPTDTKEFCKNKIRKNTIDRFINEINSYHSYFMLYYESVGLSSEPF